MSPNLSKIQKKTPHQPKQFLFLFISNIQNTYTIKCSTINFTKYNIKKKIQLSDVLIEQEQLKIYSNYNHIYTFDLYLAPDITNDLCRFNPNSEIQKQNKKMIIEIFSPFPPALKSAF